MENKIPNTLETLEALHSTHGRFSDRAILPDDLSTVLVAATRAANSSSRQAYSIIVLDDKEQMQRLVGYRASRALVFCIDFYRLGALAKKSKKEFDKNNIIEFLTCCVDVSLAAQNAVVAARALGIDSLITNGLQRKPMDLVFRELGLPEKSVFPLITVLLGYAADEKVNTKKRLPLECVVHLGRYRHPTEEELERLIALYDDESAKIGLDWWNRDEYPHYLDWFFEKWCGKPDASRKPVGKIKEFQDRLIASGFWWQDK